MDKVYHYLQKQKNRLLFGSTKVIRNCNLGEFEVKPLNNIKLFINEEQLSVYFSNNKKAKKLLVWFGGRSEHVAWIEGMTTWVNDDYDFVTFQFRGTGSSTGEPSEKDSINDAIEIIKWAKKHYKHDQIVIAGRSIGTHIALSSFMEIKSKHKEINLEKIILVSPMTNLLDIIRNYKKFSFLLEISSKKFKIFLKNSLNNLDLVRHLNIKTLVVYTIKDELVDANQTKKLIGKIEKDLLEICEFEEFNHKNILRSNDCLSVISKFLNN